MRPASMAARMAAQPRARVGTGLREVAGYGGEEGEEDQVRNAQGAAEGLSEGRQDHEQ